MKTALILNADSPAVLQQAGDINRLLDELNPGPEVEMWLFHGPTPPAAIPEPAGRVRRIELIRVEEPDVGESYLGLLEQMFRRRPVRMALFGGDDLGRELATRTAYRLGGSSCLQVQSARLREDEVTVERLAYDHNLAARFVLSKAPFCLSPARSGARPAEPGTGDDRVSRADGLVQPRAPWILDRTIGEVEAQGSLEKAEVILALGQGVGSRKNLERLEPVARALGAEIGVSRPVAMNGWFPLDRLIGASGKVLSPSVCLAAGVSGSGAFGYGIRNSDFIVALNTDEKAPIFDQADVGLAEDLMGALSLLAELVESNRRGESRNEE